jgi:hypothetical protein
VLLWQKDFNIRYSTRNIQGGIGLGKLADYQESFSDFVLLWQKVFEHSIFNMQHSMCSGVEQAFALLRML